MYSQTYFLFPFHNSINVKKESFIESSVFRLFSLPSFGGPKFSQQRAGVKVRIGEEVRREVREGSDRTSRRTPTGFREWKILESYLISFFQNPSWIHCKLKENQCESGVGVSEGHFRWLVAPMTLTWSQAYIGVPPQVDIMREKVFPRLVEGNPWKLKMVARSDVRV